LHPKPSGESSEESEIVQTLYEKNVPALRQGGQRDILARANTVQRALYARKILQSITGMASLVDHHDLGGIGLGDNFT
jgi:hypothetical protein